MRLTWLPVLLLGILRCTPPRVQAEPKPPHQHHQQQPSTFLPPTGTRVYGQLSHPGCVRYLGVPFATPPTGEMRWRAPKAIDMHDLNINATSYGPMCMQPGRGWDTLSTRPYSEDCLYLNVFTPDNLKSKRLPVMVYIHGGDYLQGGSDDTEIYGCNLVRVTGESIVVTIQYRLGVFGFLGSPQLSEREARSDLSQVERISTGNYGLLDQIAALQWVRDNIDFFGGDKDRVMIFGESAGAGSISNLLVSPLANGLFQKAVMQSGAFALWTTKRMSDAVNVYDDLLNISGCNANELDPLGCLENIPAEKLVLFASQVRAYPDQWTVCRWAPTVDGIAVKMHPSDIVTTGGSSLGLIADVPIMFGNNDEEGSSFVSETRLSSSPGIDPNSFSHQDLEQWIERNFDDASSVKKFYQLNQDEYPSAWFAAQRIVGDMMLFCPSRRAAAALHAAKLDGQRINSIFEYVFDRAPKDSKWGAYHGAEVPFVFGNIPKGVDSKLEEWELGQSMAWMWSMFARFGKPLGNRGDNLAKGLSPPGPIVDLAKNNVAWEPWPKVMELDTREGGGLSSRDSTRDVCKKLWNPRKIDVDTKRPKQKESDFPAATVAGVIFSALGIICVTAIGLLFKRRYFGTRPRDNQFDILSEGGSSAEVNMSEIDLNDLN